MSTVVLLFTLLLAALQIGASGVDVVPGHNIFADGLVAGIYDKPNECSSALGVSMCFGLVYPGASGTCAAQIQSTLQYPADSTQSSLLWGPTTARLTTAYDGRCTMQYGGTCEAKKPTLEIANSFWFRRPPQSLQCTYQGFYTSTEMQDLTRCIDFDAQSAGDTINAWVHEKTHGLIPSIVAQGPVDGDAIAINAIYLNASWTNPFPEASTNSDIFYDSSTRDTALASQAHFMHMVEELPYYSGTLLPGFQVLQLPYSSSALSMIVALPDGSGTSPTTSSAVLSVLAELRSTRMAVAFPKFKFESEYNEALTTTLQSLGMIAPFQGGFDGILMGQELLISKVIQKTFINVYEKGTEAAAVTAIQMEVTSARVDPPPDPRLFLADHPFQFWIYDATEDLVLFEGRVGNPGLVVGSAAALQGVHTETDFWSSRFGVNVVRSDGTGSTTSAAVWRHAVRRSFMMSLATFMVISS